MVSNYWISGFVAYIHTPFLATWHKNYSWTWCGGRIWDFFFSFDASVYCRSASDSCFIGLVFRWQLSYVHQKGGITTCWLFWPRAYFLLLQSRCVCCECWKYCHPHILMHIPCWYACKTAVHLLEGSIPSYFVSWFVGYKEKKLSCINPCPLLL